MTNGRSQHGWQVHHTEKRVCRCSSVIVRPLCACPFGSDPLHRRLHAQELLGGLPTGRQIFLCSGNGRDEVLLCCDCHRSTIKYQVMDNVQNDR